MATCSKIGGISSEDTSISGENWGVIDNRAGKITGLSVVRLSTRGVSGTGVLLQTRFKAKRGGETAFSLQNFRFATITGDRIPAGPHKITLTVEGQLATGDVNRDGVVTIEDLILIAQQLGKRVPAGSAVDVNGDGVVNMLDLLIVEQAIESAAAPMIASDVDAATIAGWIAQARFFDDGSLAFRQGILNLQALLRSLIPAETALLRNYPNPFNPETWIPYHLSEAAAVQITIYDVQGELIRRLEVGRQQAGYYTDRPQAAYWDGRNGLGEAVGSGVYFYHLSAGEYAAIGRMVIVK